MFKNVIFENHNFYFFLSIFGTVRVGENLADTVEQTRAAKTEKEVVGIVELLKGSLSVLLDSLIHCHASL